MSRKTRLRWLQVVMAMWLRRQRYLSDQDVWFVRNGFADVGQLLAEREA